MATVKMKAQKKVGIDISSTKPGSPGGIFMRQFWVAVHRSQDLERRHVKPIRIMSENNALYRGGTRRFRAQGQDRQLSDRGISGLIWGYFGEGTPPPFSTVSAS
ncbi:MAG: hypothetical protein ABIU95_04550 [Burkholderiales bacterium]